VSDTPTLGWSYYEDHKSERLGLDHQEAVHIWQSGETMVLVDRRVWDRDNLRLRYMEERAEENRYGHTNWDEAYAYVLKGEARFVTIEHLRSIRWTPADGDTR
jgi:hypothetical protein